MPIVTLKNFGLTLPRKILKKLHLHNGQKLLIQAKDNTIFIKPCKLSKTEIKLLNILNKPLHMGKIKYKDRTDIYDDIN